MIAERETREATRRGRLAIYREAVTIVEAEYDRSLSLEEVARRLATSPRQVQRAFAEAGATGFRSSLAQVRMARAAELLAATQLPVQEIGRRVGFRDASQFAKSFRKTYGMTPTEQRQSGRVAPSPRVDRPRSGGTRKTSDPR